ncbi:zinc finger protein 76-like isoform X2 [Littorina saxatilis]|uniref:zinc finger protein 76-like isoform X2 n=1 Tax=Littorina saxatilis TaxID=31220 RepID=UPI0038B41C7B
MDSMETVLGTGLGDEDTDAMSPLESTGHEVSELESAMAHAADMDHEDDDDDVNADGSILIPTDGTQSIVGTTADGVIGLFLQSTDANGVAMASGMKLSVSGMLPEGAVISTEPPVQAIQAVTLDDGSTAYIQQPKEGKLLEGQTVTLEDGTTAVVQGSLTPKVEPGEECKGLEATAIQLEDGTTAYLQPTSKAALHEGLHAIQLEDGTTAYIAHPNPEALFGEGAATLDAATLDSLTAQLNGVVGNGKQQMTVEKALALGDKAYKCGYEDCGRLYTTLHHLKVHERSHTGDRPFKCEHPQCGKAFATGYGLKSHTRVHTGEKPYPCPEEGCVKAFKTSGDLQKHVRTHTGERPFKCPFEGCDRSFTTSNIRKVHIRTHTGERPYLCTAENCGRAFASATNYKNHVRIHTGEKPYVCTVQGCGKRFTEYSSLYKHHVVHTHSKPYTCSHCGKTYRQTSTLAMHKRTAHGEGEECTAESEAQIFAQQEKDGGEPAQKRQRLHFTLSNTEAQTGTAEEGEGTLVINTTDAQQMTMLKGEEGVQVITDLSDQAAGLVTLPAQLSLQALQGQGIPSFTVGGEHGQQVLVVTDPSQLEMLQQLAQQHLDSENLELPMTTADIITSSQHSTITSSGATITTPMIVFQHE